MKKDLPIYLLLIFSISFSIYQESSDLFKDIPLISEQRQVDNFDIVSLNIPGNIYFIEEEVTDKIVIEGPQDVIKELELTVEQNELNVSSANFFTAENWRTLLFNKGYQLNIYIPVLAAHNLKVAGVGSLFGRVQRQEDRISIQSLGLGEIYVYSHDQQVNELSLDSMMSLAFLRR